MKFSIKDFFSKCDQTADSGGGKRSKKEGRGQVCMLAITLFKQMSPASA